MYCNGGIWLMSIYGQKINKIEIRKLKGIQNMEMTFEKPLVAIVGPNCIGKTTILDSLACVYRDSGIFGDYFITNKYNDWNESEYKVHFTYFEEGKERKGKRSYKKVTDRWTPVNSRRPIRDVHYLRISDELPAYEKKWDKDIHLYSTKENSISSEESIIRKSKAILFQNYNKISEVSFEDQKKLISVKNGEIEYLSLDMGAGEQKIIKYLIFLNSIEKYSLILLDELDVFVHPRSFKEFLVEINRIAVDRKLQIVFTTHSDVITQCSSIVDINYLLKTPEETFVLKEPNADIIYNLNGERKKEYEIFVEDALSECIIQEMIGSLGMRRKTEIICFGAAINCFTLASGLKLRNETDYNNLLFILDGDVYITKVEKESRVKQVLTGDTEIAKQQRIDVLDKITQYRLPEGKKTEEYIAEIFLEIKECDSDILEIQQVLRDNLSHENKHDIIGKSLLELNYDKKMGYVKIINLIKKEEKYIDFVKDVRAKIQTCFNIVES